MVEEETLSIVNKRLLRPSLKQKFKTTEIEHLYIKKNAAFIFYGEFKVFSSYSLLAKFREGEDVTIIKNIKSYFDVAFLKNKLASKLNISDARLPYEYDPTNDQSLSPRLKVIIGAAVLILVSAIFLYLI